MLVVTERITIPLDEFHLSFSRSSGPGGQNVNKVNTKVTLHWDVVHSASLPDDVRQRFLVAYVHRISKDGYLVLTSQRYRDQLRNRQDCLDKLSQLIQAVSQPPKRRRKTRPSRASRERRLRAKKKLSEKKQMRRRPPPAL